jgi:glycerone phosphate O-acyltransferase/fatty acyl-CoA reductase
MIGLGYYRNKIMHWFNREGVLACAYHALDAFNVKSPLEGVDPEAPRATSNGVELGELMDGALFLHSMLRMEFVRKDDSKDREQLEVAFQQMLARQVLQVRSSGKIAVAGGSQPIFSLLCNLVWPFVDSYWVAITSLFALRPGVALAPEDLLKRIQWLAETVRGLMLLAMHVHICSLLTLCSMCFVLQMYHEKLISFYESCSLETLQNAITTLENWRVIERFSTTNARGKSTPAKVRSSHTNAASSEATCIA